MVRLIISGGQSGADLSGNLFAQENGIDTEINTFVGFKPLYDKLPTDIKINYVCDGIGYNQALVCRTKYNVANSDFTIILVGIPIENTKGSKLTFSFCKQLYKDCIYLNINNGVGESILNVPGSSILLRGMIDIYDARLIIQSKKPDIINIAGERSLIKKQCIEFLERLLL